MFQHGPRASHESPANGAYNVGFWHCTRHTFASERLPAWREQLDPGVAYQKGAGRTQPGSPSLGHRLFPLDDYTCDLEASRMHGPVGHVTSALQVHTTRRACTCQAFKMGRTSLPRSMQQRSLQNGAHVPKHAAALPRSMQQRCPEACSSAAPKHAQPKVRLPTKQHRPPQPQARGRRRTTELEAEGTPRIRSSNSQRETHGARTPPAGGSRAPRRPRVSCRRLTAAPPGTLLPVAKSVGHPASPQGP